MATERIVNDGRTTVASPYVAGSSTLIVVDASKLPDLTGSDQYHVVVVDLSSTSTKEIMKVTGVSGNTLTVEPASEEIAGVQTSFNHSVGEVVANVLTNAALLQLISDNSVPGPTGPQGPPGPAGAGTFTQETPSGTVNGSNDTFTISNIPVSGSLVVYLNGIRQKEGAGNDYTFSGTTITFESGMIPQTGDSVETNYTY